MIIELLKNVSAAENFFLIHFSLINESEKNVGNVFEFLKRIPGSIVACIPDGKPCPTNPLPKITIFNVENKPLMAAIQKIADHPCTPGSLIPLKADEMKAYLEATKTGDLITI